jgi:hypothetical protein
MGRWRERPAPGALLALVLVVRALAAGCTIRARPEPPSATVTRATPTTRVATIRGTTVARRAFLLDRRWPGGPVRPAPNGPLPVALRRRTQELGSDEAVNLLLVFPLLRAPPGCVRAVELWLRVLRLDHPQAVLAAYPSLLASLASDRPTTRIGDETLIDNRPRGTGPDRRRGVDALRHHRPVPDLGSRRPVPVAGARHRAGDAAGGGRQAGGVRRAVLRGPLRGARQRPGHRAPAAVEGDPGLLSRRPVHLEEDADIAPWVDGASQTRW